MHVCNQRYAIASSSHVCLHPEYHVTMVFRYQVLIDIPSIAIWNRNKVAVTLAITVWVINTVSRIQGKPLAVVSPVENLESYGIPNKRDLANRHSVGECPISIF
jgi:hypothetical protein